MRRAAVWPAAASFAVVLPALIAYNLPPSATFFNQAAALLGWGAFLLLLAIELAPGAARAKGPSLWMAGALGLLALSALTSPWLAKLPWALALSNTGTILAALLAVLVAKAVVDAGLGEEAFEAFCIGLAVAGLASALIGIVQVYAPGWTDGQWVAHTSIVGRAVGNLRQPNHLSSLLLWSIVAVVWLGERRARAGTAAFGVAVVLLFGVVLSGSRTGTLGTLMLAAWGALDRRLSRRTRIALILAPLAYAAFWAGALEYAHQTQQVFGGEERFAGGHDISSSRFGIWSNTLALIRAHPWGGVGFGEFNFAWTLTPFPGRPVAFFDHTHNLVLQFAVELGLPLAALLLALLGACLFAAIRNAVAAGRTTAGDIHAPFQRAALVMVLMVVVHSMLEYPLWYSYFLLPASFALGLCLGVPGTSRPEPAIAAGFNTHPTRPLVIASMFLVLGATLAFYDYMRVVVIFAPPAKATSLDERIAAGRRSWFFAHHADYAAATTAAHPSEAMSAFERAPHFLLDARLMMAWATALDEAGDADRARYIAARLKEFHNEQAEAFFAVCNEPPKVDAKRPFQCEPPVKSYTYLDFR